MKYLIEMRIELQKQVLNLGHLLSYYVNNYLSQKIKIIGNHKFNQFN
jgi:hypothetical protein